MRTSRRHSGSLGVACLVVLVAFVSSSCAGASRATIHIGLTSTCRGTVSTFYEESVAGAELPFIERGAKPLGARPSDGITSISVAGKRVDLALGCSFAGSDVTALGEMRRLVEQRGLCGARGREARGAGDHRALEQFLLHASQQGARTTEVGARRDEPHEDQLAGRLARKRLGEREERLEIEIVERDDEERALRCLRPGEIQRRVLPEDRALEVPQDRPGLDPQLVDERRPRRAVDRQRFRLAARAVQREHQLTSQPFAQRTRRNERCELADQLRMPAECEVGLDATLDGRQAKLPEPRDRRLRERFVLHIAERRPSPQAECLAEEWCGSRRIHVIGLVHELLEPVDVELSPPHLDA